jgi:hypothetical protein
VTTLTLTWILQIYMFIVSQEVIEMLTIYVPNERNWFDWCPKVDILIYMFNYKLSEH